MKNDVYNNLILLNDCQRYHRSSLTRQFHHDSGPVVIADSPPRGEYGALGRPSGRDIKNIAKTLSRILTQQGSA